MTAKKSYMSLRAIGAIVVLTTLSACHSDDEDDEIVVEPPVVVAPVPYSYEVTVTNLTNAQPLSPVAVALHQEGTFWTVGESASQALEEMAEGGDNSALLESANVLAQASGSAPIGAGGSETIAVTINDVNDAKLTVATMLVNTNDAFTGVNGWDLSTLEVGASMTAYTHVYDAGTEANSEAQGSIPGPADSGEGFNAARDDVDFVAMHPGVVSIDDGLTNSVLHAEHKFDNPVTMITVTRVE
ncbi:spondin domain-containing protein [Pseudoalteromonas sp. SSDWG2]|uniref:spondin domain-containing protein n=1 Tax=Pseudoalteromonas sp. SSDWG2 TaxID=3139391 RepID=UPI003BAA189F